MVKKIQSHWQELGKYDSKRFTDTW